MKKLANEARTDGPTGVREQLKAGIGSSKLLRLRRKTAIATIRDPIAVGHKIVGAVSSEGALDSADAMGFLLQMAGELMLASANLLSNREIYAGAALLRQVTEIQYLTWAIKETQRSAENWLHSIHKERRSLFAPAQLRRTSKGRFLDKDYRDHCELGGHPTREVFCYLAAKKLAWRKGI